MEYRLIKVTFKRALSPDEQKNLVAHFKGFVEETKRQLSQEAKTMEITMRFASLLPGSADATIGMAKSRIETLVGSGELNRLFSLEFDEKKPTQYTFVHPTLTSIFGQQKYAEKLRKWGVINSDGAKRVGRAIVFEAGLERVLSAVTAEEVRKD